MPLYEYVCIKCKRPFERIEPVHAKPVKKCPLCGGRAERTLAPPAIQFKGTGWYITDYARKGAAESKAERDSDGKEKKEATAPTKESSRKSK